PSQNGIPVSVQTMKLITQIAFQRAQDFNISFRVKAAHSRPVMRETQFRLAVRRQQHQSNIDEFVFHRVRHVTQEEEAALLPAGHHCTAILCSCSASTHAGNGWREELRKAVIRSRTLPRRAMISSASFSSACQSCPTHSGGISPEISRTIPGSS